MLELVRLLESDAAAVVVLSFIVGALGFAVVTLWRHQQRSIYARLDQFRDHLDACERKHSRCERRNKDLAHAVLNILGNNDAQARYYVNSAMQEREGDEEEGDGTL